MSDFDVVQKARFDGTIIITDPCYVISNSLWDSGDIDLATGKGIEKIGITNYIWGGTVYGDWCCALEEVDMLPSYYDDGALILSTMGQFGADAGLVAVFDLNDVMSANPELTQDEIGALEAFGSAVVIDGFEGDVSLADNKGNRHIMGKGRIANGETIAFFSQQM